MNPRPVVYDVADADGLRWLLNRASLMGGCCAAPEDLFDSTRGPTPLLETSAHEAAARDADLRVCGVSITTPISGSVERRGMP